MIKSDWVWRIREQGDLEDYQFSGLDSCVDEGAHHQDRK